MEKFGLFDLIEKFNSQQNGKTDFAEKPKTDGGSVLVPPSYGAPNQVLMNEKTKAYFNRHDQLKREILASSSKKPKNHKAKPTDALSPRPKKRGRPKKSQNTAP